MLITAGRLLLRHWPVLLAVFLAGLFAHELAMRTAVQASLLSAELGMLVLVLAPLSFLVSLVLMLRVLRPSLPWLGRAGGEPPPSIIRYLGVVLLPFMTIYYFENYLFDDASDYQRRVLDDSFERNLEAASAEILGEVADAGRIDPDDRLPFTLTLTVLIVVVAAFVGRLLLSRWHAPDRRPWLGIPGAYLELIWFTTAYAAFTLVAESMVDWFGNRRLVHIVQDAWTDAMGSASGLSTPLGAVPTWMAEQFGSIDAVLVIPLAWLATAAIVLGHQPPPVVEGRARALYEQGAKRWAGVPPVVAWAADKVTSDLRSWFTPLAQGVRMLLRAGLAPMLLFCLAFVAVRTGADWMWELQRLIIGPQNFDSVWFPLYGPLHIVNRAVEYTLLACLLAAGVDRAARASRPPDYQIPAAPAGSPHGQQGVPGQLPR